MSTISFKNPFLGLLVLSVLSSWWGCAPRQIPLPGAPGGTAPPPKPVFEKTFGEMEMGEGSTLSFQYKSMRILVDPLFIPGDGGLIDYLLITDAKPYHFGSGSTQGLRKNIKIICTEQMAAELKVKGFTQVKVLNSGSRIILQKNGGNLFVTGFATKIMSTGDTVNSYLLEFDNGRNILIAGNLPDSGPVREMVYQLRDDGKEAHFGIFYGASAEEEKLSAAAALLQPQFGFIVPAGPSKSVKLKEALLQTKLKEDLFEGFILIPKAGEKFPF